MDTPAAAQTLIPSHFSSAMPGPNTARNGASAKLSRRCAVCVGRNDDPEPAVEHLEVLSQ
ncbi:MAG: hypothetical protein R2705_11655 [Ilumatobacteraceae bacterium]